MFESQVEASKRRGLTVCVLLASALAIGAWTCAVVRTVNAETMCCFPSGTSWPCAPGDADCRGPLGLQCPTAQIVPAGVCQVTAPTPTPTPPPVATATPTPTPGPQIPITLVRLPFLPWPFSYQYQVPWIQRQPDGSLVISCNSGHYPGESLTPPPLGSSSTWPGECKIAVYFPADGSTPQARQTYCSSQTTSVWETGNYQITTQTNPAEIHAYGVFTERPVGPLGGDSDRDVQLEMVVLPARPGIPTVLSPNPYRYTVLSQKGVNYMLSGIVDLAGQKMAYVEELYKFGSWPYLLRRYQVRQNGQFWVDPSFVPVKLADSRDGRGSLNLVLDHDGKTLLSTDGPWPATEACRIWRSGDQGQTWSLTGVAIPAPKGSVGIAQCGIAVKPGGEAFSPLWGVCQTFWSQDGDDGMDWTKPGDWRPYVWYQDGAQMPSNLLTAATAYPPVAPTHVVSPMPNPQPMSAKSVSVKKSVEPKWLPGAILRPQPTPTRTP